MNEADYAQYILKQLVGCIHSLDIIYYIPVATNKRIIVCVNDKRDAELIIADVKATRRGNGEPAPRYQIEKGLKTDHYYLQLKV